MSNYCDSIESEREKSISSAEWKSAFNKAWFSLVAGRRVLLLVFIDELNSVIIFSFKDYRQWLADCRRLMKTRLKAGFPLGEFVRANKQKANMIGW